MKVVIHAPSPVWGGNEKWAMLVARGIRDRGHEVVVSCRRGGPVEAHATEAGIRTSSVRPKGDVDVLSAWRFARWLRREAPDVVLETSWKRIPHVVWAVARAGRPRLVVRLGIVRRLPPRGRHARAFRRGVDAMIVNSEEIRDVWLDSARSARPVVHVVHNAIRPPDPGSLSRERFRSEIGVPPDAPLVMGVGHIFPRKGFDLLLQAFHAAGVPDARLAIVGTGEQEPELRAMADRLGIADRVHWPGFRADVADALAAADLFVLSSRNEGMANVMLEAMAVGTPVVATDISGVAYALGGEPGGGPAGWIVPPDDHAAMAAAIAEVLRESRESPGSVAARVDAARRRIRDRFGIDRMVDEVERVLRGADL